MEIDSSNVKVTTLAKSTSKIDPTGNLPHDQLAKMFPTPPSHEHNPIASPANEDNLDVKSEFSEGNSPWGSGNGSSINVTSVNDESINDDVKVNSGYDNDLADNLDPIHLKFGPLKKLYSDDLPYLKIPSQCYYKSNKSGKIVTQNNSSFSFRYEMFTKIEIEIDSCYF